MAAACGGPAFHNDKRPGPPPGPCSLVAEPAELPAPLKRPILPKSCCNTLRSVPGEGVSRDTKDTLFLSLSVSSRMFRTTPPWSKVMATMRWSLTPGIWAGRI